MLETKKRIGFFAAVFTAAFALTWLGIPEANAQTNDKRYERQATGMYKGKLLNGKVQHKPHGDPFDVANGQGKVRVPIKDGKLKTTARDTDIPGAIDKAKFKGTEKKSDVRRNGKKIIVKAGGSMEIVGGHGAKTKGTVSGDVTQRGSKHVADVRFKGERNDGGGASTCYNTKAKGRK